MNWIHTHIHTQHTHTHTQRTHPTHAHIQHTHNEAMSPVKIECSQRQQTQRASFIELRVRGAGCLKEAGEAKR